MLNELSLNIDFQKICPYLIENPPQKPTGLIFDVKNPDIIASETACENGGIPGVEKVGQGTIVPQFQAIIAHCEGCKLNPVGFNEQL